MLKGLWGTDHIPASMSANNLTSVSPFADYPIFEDHSDDWANVGSSGNIQTGMVVDSEGTWFTQQVFQGSNGGGRAFQIPLAAVFDSTTRASYMGYRFKTNTTQAGMGASHVMSISDGASRGDYLVSMVPGNSITIIQNVSMYIEHKFDRVANLITTSVNGTPQPAMTVAFVPAQIANAWFIVGQNGGPAVPALNANIFQMYKDFYFVDDTQDNRLPNGMMGPQLLKPIIAASAAGTGWNSSDSQPLLTDLLSPVTAVAGTQTAPLISAPTAGAAAPLVVGFSSSLTVADVVNAVTFLSGVKIDALTAQIAISVSDNATPTPNVVPGKIIMPVDSNVHLGRAATIMSTAPDGSAWTPAKIGEISLIQTPRPVPNTALLMHFDGINGGNSFKEETGSQVSTIGTPSLSSVQSKFGTTSLSNPSTSSWLQVPDSPMLRMLGDFTLEFWVFLTSVSTECVIFEKSLTSYPAAVPAITARAWVEIINGVLCVKLDGTGAVQAVASSAASANVWHHMAVVKHGTTVTGYVDGVVTGTFTSSATWGNNPGAFVIGSNEIGSVGLTGFMDEARASILARYTAAFTPPVAPFVLD